MALAVFGGVAALVLVALPTHAGQSGPSPRQIRHELAAAVTTSPGDGATSVPLDSPISVYTSLGRLRSVVVTDGAGQPVSGTLDPSDTTWTATQPLAAGTTYRVDATVAGRSRVAATTVASFTTVTPSAWVHATLWPDSGLSVGVGQPIVLTFDHPVTDPAARAAVLSHLHLSMSSPVAVGAYWFSSTELHLRPESLWPSGEQISLSDSLDGWDAGGGNWGQGSDQVTFSIGDARISTANLITHQMTVTDNGKVVATYPLSGGSDQYPTMGGVHIVMDRETQVRMVSSTVGIPVDSPGGYDEIVYWDVHISDSGEYVHAAPWSVADQGNTNVSHGCINLSPADAQQFYGFSRVGDIVDVVGSPRPPAPGDHGVMDWSTPWSSFTPIPVTPLPA
ncbi:MAG TPA: Ig-like domain-containing protein [Acidimicrobiales bacterium]|nr:Ig-like domain-containing protein [Acidimicrobiales bacterium]